VNRRQVLASLLPELSSNELEVLLVLLSAERPLSKKEIFLKIANGNGHAKSYSEIGKSLRKLVRRGFVTVIKQSYFISPGLVLVLLDRAVSPPAGGDGNGGAARKMVFRLGRLD
jgi:hypothetical protein